MSFSESERRALSWILTAVLALASLPLTAGVVIVAGGNQPEFTVNICQPIQTFDRAANASLARPASMVPQFTLVDLGLDGSGVTSRVVELLQGPDPPPPKRLA